MGCCRLRHCMKCLTLVTAAPGMQAAALRPACRTKRGKCPRLVTAGRVVAYKTVACCIQSLFAAVTTSC